jgi:adenylate kinase family enzyme
MPPQRLAIVGTSGCGKTTLARQVADRLAIPYVSADAIYWRPDWVPNPKPVQIAETAAFVKEPAWVTDGNQDPDSDRGRLVLGRVEQIVWLDLPRRTVWSQLLWRTIRRSWTREPLFHGNRESWRKSFFSRDSILVWSVQSFGRNRRRYERMQAQSELPDVTIVRLRSRRAVRRWLGSLGDGSTHGAGVVQKPGVRPKARSARR